LPNGKGCVVLRRGNNGNGPDWEAGRRGTGIVQAAKLTINSISTSQIKGPDMALFLMRKRLAAINGGFSFMLVET
jgi:hypothetical protein